MKKMRCLQRRNYYVHDVIFADRTYFEKNILYINKNELIDKIKPLFKSIKSVDFEIAKPRTNTRIIHLMDTIAPMIKVEGEGGVYSGHLSDAVLVGEGKTNVMCGFTVMESAKLPWDDTSASSGLLYPREAILDMKGPIAQLTPFSKAINLVIIYNLIQGKSAEEYDTEIRNIALTISRILAETTLAIEPDETEEFTIDKVDEKLPNVVLVWNSQNQGTYANTYLYGEAIDNMVPTVIHPNEMLDGCVVSGNYVWPAFKVPTYLYSNHPIVMELYKNHGKTLNFKGIIFGRSHNPTNWHKKRCANIALKLAQMLESDGAIMAWEGGGNAATDGMSFIQAAEKHGIKTSTITFEFGGCDGSEGILLVDDVPEADAIISAGSIEQIFTIPQIDKVIGGETLRLNKESGGDFPQANDEIRFEQTIHFYLGGNQSGASSYHSEAY